MFLKPLSRAIAAASNTPEKLPWMGNGGPTPPDLVLLCPYVMDSQDLSELGINVFDSFTYSNGIFVGTATTATTQQTGGAKVDLDAFAAGNPIGKAVSLPAGNGKITFEAELTSVTTEPPTIQVQLLTTDGVAQFAQATMGYLGNIETITAEIFGELSPGLMTTSIDGTMQMGDRVAITLDTDTGQVDFVCSAYHENFGGAAVLDLTDPAAFQVVASRDSNETQPLEVTAYTKASDMVLPAPAGTKDTCGNAVSRELVTYPLDASEAEVQGIGLTGKLDNPSLAQQRGEYTVLDGTPAGPGQYAMIRSQSDPGFINNWSTGKVAMEWDITVPTFTPELAGGTGTIVNNLGAVLNAGTFQSIVSIGVFLDENGDRSLSTIIGSDQTITEISQDINRLGLLIDNDTNTLRVWLNGVEQVFNDPSFAANTFDAVTPLSSVLRVTTDDNGAAGLKMVNRYITDPYWFTTPFPPGSVAIDGTTAADGNYSPLAVFADGTDGFWGDSTDSATLFEDATGTTPAQPGDFCGLRLDKSQGLVLGPEEVTNGDFSDGFNGWVEVGPNHTIVAGRARIDGAEASNGGIYQDMSVTPGSFAKVRIGYYSLISGGIDGRAFFYDGANFSSSVLFLNPINTDEVIVGPITTGTLRVRTYAPASDTVFDIDDITVKVLAGNHQRQPTTASKPTVQIVDGVQALVLDDDDDSMLIDVPTGGWSGTFVQGTALGVVVGEIDVPAGPYQIPTDPNYAGPGSDIHTVIVNGSIPDNQINGLVEWVGQRCPVADFSTTTAVDSWFRNRDDLTALDFSRADGGSLIDLAGLVLNASNLTRLTLGGLITSTAADLGNMVRGTMLTSLDLSDSVTSGVTDCTNFARGTPLETLTLNGGSGSPFSDSPCINYSGAFIGTNLNQQSYTDIVTAIEAAGTSNGTLNITGGTSTTTGAAQTAVDALRGRGWTVTTPDGY